MVEGKIGIPEQGGQESFEQTVSGESRGYTPEFTQPVVEHGAATTEPAPPTVETTPAAQKPLESQSVSEILSGGSLEGIDAIVGAQSKFDQEIFSKTTPENESETGQTPDAA